MKRLRIATLNCLNLALPARHIYDGYPPYSSDEYLAKTQWLAALFDRMAADIVLVQEVFHEAALGDVIRQTSAGAAGWRCAVPLAPQDNTRPRVGLAWHQSLAPRLQSVEALPAGCAVPVPELGEHAAFSRPLLRVELTLGATPLTLFNVHLKSRRPDVAPGEDATDFAVHARAQLRALVKRAAEATAVRRLVCDELAARPEVPLLVGGDFNDEANSVTTRLVADSSCRTDGETPSGPELRDVLALASTTARVRDAAFTILHAGEPERIDHLLLSQHFSARADAVVGVELFADHLWERRRAPAPGVAPLARVYSDHAALCATLQLPG